MIQYLINATAIWLLSLIIFDLFLKRSTHHTYSRAYLLITSMFGALLPLYRGTDQAIVPTPALMKPMQAVANTRISIVRATEIPDAHFSLSHWIIAVYLIGVAIAFLMILREALTLLRWYRGGQVMILHGQKTVVTWKDHGPCSLLGFVFISDPAAYTDEELLLILRHEAVHIRQAHFLDKLLLLTLRTIFWFHPLAYIYYRKLMLVHEYEADDHARSASRQYGLFLLAQHLAGASPELTHSFFHSPLKNRIRMLTSARSSTRRKIAYAVAIPAITAFALLWVQNTQAHDRERKGNKLTFHGNTFEMGLPRIGGSATTPGPNQVVIGGGSGAVRVSGPAPAPATPIVDTVFDPFRNVTIMTMLDSVPVKMNGLPIYNADDLTTPPALRASTSSLLDAIVSGAQAELSKLPEGKYIINVNELIVDRAGHVVYYTLSPIRWHQTSFSPKSQEDFNKGLEAAIQEKKAHPIDEALSVRIHSAVEQTLDGLVLTPGRKGGKAVVSRSNLFAGGLRELILVENNSAKVYKAW